MPVALIAGASRGVGRGTALGLASAGFSVFATGRGIDSADLPASVARIRCDHLNDEETANAFAQVAAAADRLDLLVNSVWGGYERMTENGEFTWALPFWQQPAYRWTGMMDAGVRASFFASAEAAKLMVPAGSGLIVNISYWAAKRYTGNSIYGISKAAMDKMSADMAHELRAHDVAVVSLYPGLVRTEAVMAAAAGGWLDISNSESPEFIGRVIAALFAQPNLMRRSGEVLVAAQLAMELGVRDIDGRQPHPLTIETA